MEKSTNASQENMLDPVLLLIMSSIKGDVENCEFNVSAEINPKYFIDIMDDDTGVYSQLLEGGYKYTPIKDCYGQVTLTLKINESQNTKVNINDIYKKFKSRLKEYATTIYDHDYIKMKFLSNTSKNILRESPYMHLKLKSDKNEDKSAPDLKLIISALDKRQLGETIESVFKYKFINEVVNLRSSESERSINKEFFKNTVSIIDNYMDKFYDHFGQNDQPTENVVEKGKYVK